MSPIEETYSFGYDIGPDGHFHHENRALDGVTYGCYGHVDPQGKLHATHYLADSRGYRVVQPTRPAVIFIRLPNSRRFRKEVRDWEELSMPAGCGERKTTQSDILGGLLGSITPVVGAITDTVTGLVNGTLGGLTGSVGSASGAAAGVATTPAVMLTVPPISVTTPVSTGASAAVTDNSTSVASTVSSA
ncbi:hypothetical protein pipiens_014888 [Culex pipiens pipiens]|uniref:Cuticle protein 6 n=1 Tax=Culex pipiens pipiens TaxID=38569 RepID=A0ABD1CSP8_CULPP